MGIAWFARWLFEKHGQDILRDLPELVDDEEILRRSLEPARSARGWQRMPAPANYNSMCESLFVDLNGVVHPVTHPGDREPPATEADMMLHVFDYLDRLVLAARPSKLLFLALDGVAPRAKMNQQRSRRFVAAADREAGKWDYNAITPGTEFQAMLARHLRFYAHARFAGGRVAVLRGSIRQQRRW